MTSASDVDGLTMVAQGYNYGSGFLDWSRKRDTRNGRLTSQRNFPTVRADIMAQKAMVPNGQQSSKPARL